MLLHIVLENTDKNLYFSQNFSCSSKTAQKWKKKKYYPTKKLEVFVFRKGKGYMPWNMERFALNQNIGKNHAGGREEESVAEVFAGNKNSPEQFAIK